jgi:hypothetical protein
MAHLPLPSRDGPSPGLTRSATAPMEMPSPRLARSHLAPEDAFTSQSSSRRDAVSTAGHDLGNELRPRNTRSKLGSRSRSRRRKRSWKKLLWVKQSCTSIIAIYSLSLSLSLSLLPFLLYVSFLVSSFLFFYFSIFLYWTLCHIS